MSLRVILTYLPDSESIHLPTVEIDMDGDISVRGCNLTPRLSLKLKELATQLTAFYLDMNKENKEK